MMDSGDDSEDYAKEKWMKIIQTRERLQEERKWLKSSRFHETGRRLRVTRETASFMQTIHAKYARGKSLDPVSETPRSSSGHIELSVDEPQHMVLMNRQRSWQTADEGENVRERYDRRVRYDFGKSRAWSSDGETAPRVSEMQAGEVWLASDRREKSRRSKAVPGSKTNALADNPEAKHASTDEISNPSINGVSIATSSVLTSGRTTVPPCSRREENKTDSRLSNGQCDSYQTLTTVRNMSDADRSEFAESDDASVIKVSGAELQSVLDRESSRTLTEEKEAVLLCAAGTEKNRVLSQDARDQLGGEEEEKEEEIRATDELEAEAKHAGGERTLIASSSLSDEDFEQISTDLGEEGRIDTAGDIDKTTKEDDVNASLTSSSASDFVIIDGACSELTVETGQSVKEDFEMVDEVLAGDGDRPRSRRGSAVMALEFPPPPPPEISDSEYTASKTAEESESNIEVRDILREDEKEERGRKRERRKPRDVKNKKTYSDQEVRNAVETLRESSRSRSRPQSRAQSCHSDRSSPGRPTRYYDWNTTHFYPDVIDVDDGCRSGRRGSFGSAYSSFVEEEWVQDLYHYDQVDMQGVLDHHQNKEGQGMAVNVDTGKLDYSLKYERVQSGAESDRSSSSSADDTPKVWKKSPLHVKRRKREDRTPSQEIRYDPTSDDQDESPRRSMDSRVRKSPRVTRKNSDIKEKMAKFDELQKKRRALDSTSDEGNVMAHLKLRSQLRQKFIQEKHAAIFPEEDGPPLPPPPPAEEVVHINGRESYILGDSEPQWPDQFDFQNHESKETVKRIDEQFFERDYNERQCVEDYKNISSSFENLYDGADLSLPPCDMHRVELYREQQLEMETPDETPVKSVSQLREQFDQQTSPKWYVPKTEEAYENQEAEREFRKLDAKSLIEEEKKRFEVYKREYVRRVSERESGDEKMLSEGEPSRKAIPPDDYEYVLHKIHHPKPDSCFVESVGTRQQGKTGSASTSDSAFSPTFTDRPPSARSDSSAMDKPSRSDIFEERIKQLRREREESMRQLSEYTEETFFSDQSPHSQDSTQAPLVESVPDIVPKDEPTLERPAYEDDPYYYPQSQNSYPVAGRYDRYDTPPTEEEPQQGVHRPQSAPVSWYSMPEIPKDPRTTQRLPHDQMDFYSYRPGEQPSSFREGQRMSHHPGFYRDDRGHERRMPASREHPYNRDRFRSDPKMYAHQQAPDRRVMDELGLLPGPRYYGDGWQQREPTRQQREPQHYQSRPSQQQYNAPRAPPMLDPLNSTKEQYRMSYQENPLDVVDHLSTPRTSHVQLETLEQPINKRRAQYEKAPMDAYKELTRPTSRMTYLTEELMENYDYMKTKAGSSMSSLASESKRTLDDVDARLQINGRPQEIGRTQSARHPGERPVRSVKCRQRPISDRTPVESDRPNYERRPVDSDRPISDKRPEFDSDRPNHDTDRPNYDRTPVEFGRPISERRPVESDRPNYERPLNAMPNGQQYYRKSPDMEIPPFDYQQPHPNRDQELRRSEPGRPRNNRQPDEPEWIPHRRSLPASRASHEWPMQSLPRNLPNKSHDIPQSHQSLPRGAIQSQRQPPPNTSHYDTLPSRQAERVPTVYDVSPTQLQAKPRTEEPIQCPPDQEDWEKIVPSLPLSPQEKMEPYNPESKRRMDPEVYRKPPPEKSSRIHSQHSQPPQHYKPTPQDARQYIPDRSVYSKQAPRKPPHSDPFFDQFKPSQRPEEKARISATDLLFSGRPVQDVPRVVHDAPRPIQKALRPVQDAPRPVQEAPRSIQDVPRRREEKEFEVDQEVVFRNYDDKVKHKMNQHRRSMATDQYEDHIKKSQEKYRAQTSATLESGRARARSSPSEYIDAELIRQRKYDRSSPPESRASLPEERKTARVPYKHKAPNFPQTKQLVKQLSKSQENIVFKQEEEEIPKVNIAEIRGKLFGEHGEKLPKKMLIPNELVEVWDRDDRRRINSIKSDKFSSRDQSVPRYVSQSSVKMYSEDEPDQRLIDYVSYKDGQMKRRSNINDVLTDLEKTYERLDQDEEERVIVDQCRSTQSLSGLKRLSIENVRRLEELQRHFDQLEYAKQWLATDRRPTDVEDDVFGDGASSVASGALSMTSDRHSTLPRKKADDMAYRRVHRGSSGSKVDWPNQRSHSPAPSSDTRQSSASALLRDEIRDDLFANKRQQRGRSPETDALLLANPSPTTADYLNARTTAPARARLRIEGDKNADKYHDDLAYRSLRKDVAPVVCEIPRSYYQWRVEDSRRSTSLERTLSERVYKNKVEQEESLQRSKSFSTKVPVATVAMNPSKSIAKVVQMLNVPVSCSQSAPDLADETCFSGHYDQNGEYISDDPKFTRVGSKQIRKQQTPRTVKHRHDAKTRSRGFKSSGADSGYLESESDSYSSAGGGEHFSPEDDRPDITRLTDSSSSETLRKGLPREQDDYVSQVHQRAGHPMQAERRYKSDHMLYKGSGPLKNVPMRETSKQRAARLQKMKEEWLKQADSKASEKSISKAELKITSPVHQKAELHAELLSRKTPLRSVTSSKKVEISPPHSSIFQAAPQQVPTHKTIYDTKLKAPPSIIKGEEIEHELHLAKEREMKSVESIVKENHDAYKEKKEFTIESIPIETSTTIKEIKTEVRDQGDRSKREDRTPWTISHSERDKPRSRTTAQTRSSDGFTEEQKETVTEEPSKLSFFKELKVTQEKDNQKMSKTQTQRMQKEQTVAKDTITKRQQYQAETKTEKLTVSERSYPMSAQESNNIFSNAVQGEILTTRVFSPPNFRSSVLSPDISDGEMTDATDITLDALVRCNQRPFSPDTVDLSDYDEVSRVMDTEPRWSETRRTHTKTFVNPYDEAKEPPNTSIKTVTETTTEVVRRRENKKEIDKERRLSIKELVSSFEEKASPFLRARPLSGSDFTPVEESKQS